ncbi:hypothetical protein [Pseudomonas kitaguniensis]|uniref:hypothetical protein n=1 Tax=Pseudomonas kitaguniensis TaxID=2607908 RepID=UPI003BA040D4
MQLHEVDVIQELFSVKEVNEALAQGWRIVAVVSSIEPGLGDLPVACYVMGRYAKAKSQLPEGGGFQQTVK